MPMWLRSINWNLQVNKHVNLSFVQWNVSSWILCVSRLKLWAQAEDELWMATQKQFKLEVVQFQVSNRIVLGSKKLLQWLEHPIFDLKPFLISRIYIYIFPSAAGSIFLPLGSLVFPSLVTLGQAVKDDKMPVYRVYPDKLSIGRGFREILLLSRNCLARLEEKEEEENDVMQILCMARDPLMN